MYLIAIITSGLIGICLAILDGRETLISEVPFLGRCASRIDPNGVTYFFGAIVLEDFLLLTTATMCQAPKTHPKNIWHMVCVFGLATSADVKMDENVANVLEIDKNLFLHPKWSRGDAQKRDNNNFCIMRTRTKIRYGKDVQKAALPFNTENWPKDDLIAFGWGRQNPNIYTEPLVLRSRPFPLIARWRNSDLHEFGYRDRIAKTTFGDNGGPMYSRKTGKVFALICNRLEDPADKMNGSQWEQTNEYFFGIQISSVRNWIDEIRLKHNKPPS